MKRLVSAALLATAVIATPMAAQAFGPDAPSAPSGETAEQILPGPLWPAPEVPEQGEANNDIDDEFEDVPPGRPGDLVAE